MGRFEGLNDDTKDLVTCLLPALAASFGLSDPVDIIPEDIRMRAWDCERRDHIKGETENDPRNWGVQFLKDLKAISRLNNGNLTEFQEILRGKVALHEPKHPWCRLADIKEIKDEYEHPEKKNKVVVEEEEESSSSTDSYFEELVEPDVPTGKKRTLNSGRHEVYEARVIEKRRKQKPRRLRRSPTGGFQRHDPHAKKRRSMDSHHSHSNRTSLSGRTQRQSRIISSDDEASVNSPDARSLYAHTTPAFSVSPGPSTAHMYNMELEPASNEPLAVQKLQAELEVAEAELKAARLKYQYIQAREQAEREALYGGDGHQTFE
ncbi:hypothetical protein CFE70_008346 [Pyrenophora teres f. teres 0-1]|uniref:Uncharacterized protein n=2 Tax=Pyrenophora teres f. teres TaxID=97479 RepID=E3RTB5_PYRTT|nr:hypothetical protein PTT_12233 [Pyrenophora teres f. teres 0-1]KAE8830218.1 hypothetical protein HRS9139_06842 [Pyrenophora teres f. teres]KAE8859543.1 hypothetical protein PTNB29_06774 [Pyrenophora teres f. teres]KAK1914763.1 hypothetical protein P3342_010752 [Pyrenophora teres f. teres]CAE7201930.1 hypothetical protein PTTW11_08940 [Pyrenophora teres f. teres]